MSPKPRKKGGEGGAASPRGTRGAGLLGGLVLGTTIWVCAMAMRLPEIMGLDRPYALAGAALAGLLLGLTPLRRILSLLNVALALTILLVAYTPLIVAPAKRQPRRDPAGGVPVDAVAVLSGLVTDDGLLADDATDRLLSGLAAIRGGAAPRLIISRNRPSRSSPVTSDADQRRLISLLGDPVEVYVVDSVHSTHDEAVKMAEVARRHGWSRLMLVTSPMHSRRACATFEKQGLSIVCAPSESRDIAFGALSGPQDRLFAFGDWLYEVLGTALYRARGWV